MHFLAVLSGASGDISTIDFSQEEAAQGWRREKVGFPMAQGTDCKPFSMGAR
jgi:hypothetical protein